MNEPRHPDPRVQRVVAFFEQLREADLAQLPTLYAPQASFKDPFNDVVGVPAIHRVFGHMFRSLEEPRFEVRDIVVEGDRAWLTWDFLFRFKRSARAQRVHGASLLHFAPDGRIARHRDYWDAARELYETLPMIGGLMRWLRRRASAT